MVFKKKEVKKEEIKKDEFVIDMKNKDEKDFDKFKLIGGFITALAVIIIINLFVFMKGQTDNKLLIGISAFGLIGAFLGVIGFNIVKKTVGWKLGIKLFKLRKLRYKGHMLLKIFDLSGIPQYKEVKASPRITYNYIENGEKKDKVVFFNQQARYFDFNGIPVIDCNPNDISPKNPYGHGNVVIAPEIVEKNIVDNSKSAEQIDNLKQWRKYLIIIVVILLVGGFVSFDLIANRLAEANEATIACYKEGAKTATIVAGAGLTKIKNKLLK
jgi:hypothetical protein